MDSLWLSGNREEAMRRSAQAKKWNIAGIVAGVAVYVVAVILIIVGNVVAAAAASGN